MAFTALLFIMVALFSERAISQQDGQGTCGPFQLTTTSGALYSAPNGTQLPGNSKNSDDLEIGEYLISDDGTITTYNGTLCQFRPFLVCLPNITHSEGDGAFVVGEFGRLSYSDNNAFSGCSPTVEDGSIYNDMRIFPGGTTQGSGITSCSDLSMQASRCHPGENETSTNTTGETDGANSTEDVTTTSGSTGMIMGLSTSLYSLALVLGFVLL